jgi:hypothetical protein
MDSWMPAMPFGLRPLGFALDNARSRGIVESDAFDRRNRAGLVLPIQKTSKFREWVENSTVPKVSKSPEGH